MMQTTMAKEHRSARQGARAAVGHRPADHPLRGAHDMLGNQGMQRLVGAPRGAAPVAASVTPGTLQRSCGCDSSAGCECGQQAPALPWLQRQAGPGGGGAPSSGTAAAALRGLGSGRPLDSGSRSFMEPRFGRDFSGVRIHTDAAAAHAARTLHANAFTIGGDIHFAEGKYRPDTAPGRRLLAHELTHTVQQGGQGGAVARSVEGVSDPHDASEREAESVAAAVAGGAMVQPLVASSPASIQRQDDGGSSLWDDFKSGVTSVAGSVVQGAKDLAGEVKSAAGTVVQGAEDLAKTATGAISSGVAAVGSAVSSAESAVSGYLLEQANALAARFGGSVAVTPAGLVITIRDMEIDTVEDETFVLPVGIPTQTLFEAGFSVGPFVINAWVGSVFGDPSVTIATGPIALQNIVLVLNPSAGAFSGTAELYIGSAVVGSVEKADEARLEAVGVIPFDPPIPVVGSAEVGNRTIWRLVGKEGVRNKIAVSYAGGAFDLNVNSAVQLGGIAAQDHEAFLRIEVEGDEICSLIWPFKSISISRGIEISRGLTIANGPGGWSVKRGVPTSTPIPVDAIKTDLQGDHAPEHCMGLTELAAFLCEKGLIPPNVCNVLCSQGVLTAKECALFGPGGGDGGSGGGGGGGGLTPTGCDPLNRGAQPKLTEGDANHGRVHIENRHAFKTGIANSWFLESGTTMPALTELLGAALPLAKGNWKGSPDREKPEQLNCVAPVAFGTSRQVGWEVRNRKTDPPNLRPLNSLFIVVRSDDLEVASMFPMK
jgi:hypothetical protein